MDDSTETPQPDSLPVPPPDTPVPPPLGDTPATDTPTPTQPTEVKPQPADTAKAAEPSPPSPEDDPTQDATPEPPADTTQPPKEAAPSAAPVDAGASTGDASDFTMSDVTFSDTGGDRLATWAGLKTRLHSLWTRARPGTSSGRAKTATSRGRWSLRAWQWALIGFGILVLAFGVFIGVDSGVYYGKIHSGVSVAGEDLGGMDREEATAHLSEKVEEAQQNPIEISSGTRKWTVSPSDFDVVIDVQAAVDSAFGLTRDNDLLRDLGKKIALYFDGDELPLEGTADEARIEALIATIAVSLDVPPTDAHLVIEDGVVKVLEGEQGTAVDKQTLRTSLISLLFSFHSSELSIPLTVVTPDLTAEDIKSALPEADVMTDADLVLTHDGKTLVTLSPEQILGYLAVEQRTVDGVSSAVPILSPEKMSAMFDSIDEHVGDPGVDAGLVMDPETETLSVVEGIDGTGLDREATATALTLAAKSTDTVARTAEAILMTVPPELTTEEVEAMGIKDILATYATVYVCDSSRQTNVRLGTSNCSGVLLAPGDIFDTDERLGPRDGAHGWAKAPGIVGGGELEDVYGGGICQVSTTLWNAVLLAGLQIVERHNHSLYIGHYPLGRDATVTAGGKNMRFRNDTENYILIWGESDGIHTKFYVWGVDDGREVAPIKWSGWYSVTGEATPIRIFNPYRAPGSREVIVDGQRGRKCHVTRTITYADGTTKSVVFYSSYPKIAKIVEVGPTTTTTTAASTTSSITTTTTAP